MHKYHLRFWFEHCGTCIWGVNEQTKEKYGYYIECNSLPISAELVSKLKDLELEYGTILDWSDPGSGYVWTAEQTECFLARSNQAYEELKAELSPDFLIDNMVQDSIA